MARIVHLISHPTQYNAPLYRRIAKQFSFEVWYERGPQPYYDPGFNRQIEWEVDLACGYEWEVVATRKLADAFKRRKPDVLWVHGYSTPRAVYAIMLAIRHGCKVWLRGESHLALPSSLTKMAARSVSLPRLFKAADVCLYIGTLNRAFYEHYGVTHKKLVFMPYCVDNEFWMDHPIVPRENFVLYVGKLLPEKGIDHLLKVADALPHVKFVVAGDGPLAVNRPNITKLGFCPPKALRELYHAAKLVLMPSHYEPWGLVVNEALCCGTPVITGTKVASSIDLQKAWIVGEPFDNLWNLSNHHSQFTSPVEQALAHDWPHGAIQASMNGWSYDQDLEAIEVALKR